MYEPIFDFLDVNIAGLERDLIRYSYSPTGITSLTLAIKPSVSMEVELCLQPDGAEQVVVTYKSYGKKDMQVKLDGEHRIRALGRYKELYKEVIDLETKQANEAKVLEVTQLMMNLIDPPVVAAEAPSAG